MPVVGGYLDRKYRRALDTTFGGQNLLETTLVGQDTMPAGRGNGVSYDWPDPYRTCDRGRHWQAIDDQLLNTLLGRDIMYGDPGQFGNSYDFPNLLFRKHSYRYTWIWQDANDTLGQVIEPIPPGEGFFAGTWLLPNPNRYGQALDDLLLTTLLSQDKMSAGAQTLALPPPPRHLRRYGEGPPATIPFATLYSALIAGLGSYWKLDEASGTRKDSYGTADLAPTNAPGNAAGIINNALALIRNSTQFVSYTGASLDLTTTDSWSFSGWIYPTGNFAGYYTIVSNGNVGPGKVYLLLEDITGHIWRWDGFDSGIVAPDSVWTHVVYTFESQGADTGIERFYVNGTLVNSRTGSVPAPLTGTMAIGDAGATHLFNGRIDESGFWKRTLTADEVSQLYNSGAGLAWPLTVAVQSPGAQTFAPTWLQNPRRYWQTIDDLPLTTLLSQDAMTAGRQTLALPPPPPHLRRYQWAQDHVTDVLIGQDVIAGVPFWQPAPPPLHPRRYLWTWQDVTDVLLGQDLLPSGEQSTALPLPPPPLSPRRYGEWSGDLLLATLLSQDALVPGDQSWLPNPPRQHGGRYVWTWGDLNNILTAVVVPQGPGAQSWLPNPPPAHQRRYGDASADLLLTTLVATDVIYGAPGQAPAFTWVVPGRVVPVRAADLGNLLAMLSQVQPIGGQALQPPITARVPLRVADIANALTLLAGVQPPGQPQTAVPILGRVSLRQTDASNLLGALLTAGQPPGLQAITARLGSQLPLVPGLASPPRITLIGQDTIYGASGQVPGSTVPSWHRILRLPPLGAINLPLMTTTYFVVVVNLAGEIVLLAYPTYAEALAASAAHAGSTGIVVLGGDVSAEATDAASMGIILPGSGRVSP